MNTCFTVNTPGFLITSFMYSAPFQCRRARYCEPYCIAGTRPVQAASKTVKEVDLLSFEQLSLRFKD